MVAVPLNVSPSCFSLPGSRSTRQTQFAVYNNTDKENILPNSDEDEDDGPILYRDEDNMEDEGKTSHS